MHLNNKWRKYRIYKFNNHHYRSCYTAMLVKRLWLLFQLQWCKSDIMDLYVSNRLISFMVITFAFNDTRQSLVPLIWILRSPMFLFLYVQYVVLYWICNGNIKSESCHEHKFVYIYRYFESTFPDPSRQWIFRVYRQSRIVYL